MMTNSQQKPKKKKTTGNTSNTLQENHLHLRKPRAQEVSFKLKINKHYQMDKNQEIRDSGYNSWRNASKDSGSIPDPSSSAPMQKLAICSRKSVTHTQKCYVIRNPKTNTMS